MGNGEAKELICTTHEHKLKWENAGGRAGYRVEGNKGEKKWDNCNNIINKIYFKNNNNSNSTVSSNRALALSKQKSDDWEKLLGRSFSGLQLQISPSGNHSLTAD